MLSWTQPYPRVCRPHNTAAICNARYRAVESGEMIAFRGRWRPGWIFPVEQYRFGAPYPIHRWTFCPFCGGTLPRVRSNWELDESLLHNMKSVFPPTDVESQS